MSQVNNKACGASGIKGANTKKGCPFNFGNIEGVGIIAKDASFTPTNINEASFKALQAAGKLEVLQGVDGVEFTGNDDTLTATTKGINQVTQKGQYQFKVTFVKDLFFQSVLTSIDSFDQWDTFLWDEAGNLLFTQKKDGTVVGYETGMLSAGKMIFANSDSILSQTLEFQWKNRDDFDRYFAYVDASELDFDMNSYEGVIQANVSYASAPAATDTTLLVKAVYERGGSSSITSLTDTTDWNVDVNGTVANPTAVSYNAGTGNYELTIPALSASQIVKTSIAGIVDKTGDGLYKSNTVTATVA